MNSNSPPQAGPDQLPAMVFACLIPREIRILILPGVGLANGGVPFDISIDLVSPELRIPNTPLWVKLSSQMEVIRTWKRELELELELDDQ